MSRPSTEGEYLARMVPPSVAATSASRRSVLKVAAGAGALLGLPGLLAACSSDSSSKTDNSGSAAPASGGAGGGGKVSGTVSVGSNASDETPKKVLAAEADAFTKKTGADVKINTVDHNTFQENINNYLQGQPDDVFTWFAGYRMRFFAAKGLAGDISSVWNNLSGFSDAFKKASTGDDGKQYLVPSDYYPWAVFYRKSLWKEKGYEVPKTLDDFVALSKKMQGDGLVPVAFADKDGWPAMGTFDALNMRVNGYDFHISLMAGKESWDSDKVKKVFDTWKGLLPYHQPDALGRTWQEAAQSLQQKKSGMYLLGLFVAQQFGQDEQDDIDFFTFPEVDSTIGSDALDAPIDGFMMAKNPKNEDAAKAFLTFLGSPEAGNIGVKIDPGTLQPNMKTDTSGYTALQQKAAKVVGDAKSIAQFLDRDTRPDFASTVMIPALQDFIKNPNDIDGLTKRIEQQKKAIFV